MLTNGVLAIVFANNLTTLPMLAWQKLLLDFWEMQLRDLQRPQPTPEPDKPFLPSRSRGVIVTSDEKSFEGKDLNVVKSPLDISQSVPNFSAVADQFS